MATSGYGFRRSVLISEGQKDKPPRRATELLRRYAAPKPHFGNEGEKLMRAILVFRSVACAGLRENWGDPLSE